MIYTNEDKLQAKCFQLTWNFFPYLRRLFWHVPNGKKRTQVEASQLKAMGVVAGVGDVHFFFKNRFVVFELKVGDNQLSQLQGQWKSLVEEQGGEFWEVRDIGTWKVLLWKRILGLNYDEKDRLGRTWEEWRDYV